MSEMNKSKVNTLLSMASRVLKLSKSLFASQNECKDVAARIHAVVGGSTPKPRKGRGKRNVDEEEEDESGPSGYEPPPPGTEHEETADVQVTETVEMPPEPKQALVRPPSSPKETAKRALTPVEASTSTVVKLEEGIVPIRPGPGEGSQPRTGSGQQVAGPTPRPRIQKSPLRDDSWRRDKVDGQRLAPKKPPSYQPRETPELAARRQCLPGAGPDLDILNLKTMLTAPVVAQQSEPDSGSQAPEPPKAAEEIPPANVSPTITPAGVARTSATPPPSTSTAVERDDRIRRKIEKLQRRLAKRALDATAGDTGEPLSKVSKYGATLSAGHTPPRTGAHLSLAMNAIRTAQLPTGEALVVPSIDPLAGRINFKAKAKAPVKPIRMDDIPRGPRTPPGSPPTGDENSSSSSDEDEKSRKSSSASSRRLKGSDVDD
ncbi:hypothetical protein AAVH_12902 [Aphelenchoides avenae]|nr:hypothetical protein AAVH_12902 [Aphelenchus avenae]